MNRFFTWLLDIETLDLGAEGVRLGFERPLPGWAWPGLIGAILVVSFWSYRRLEGSRAARMVLATLRALLLATIVTLIAGPRLVERDETVERDWVVVLADRSASMTIEDAENLRGDRESREAQLRTALSQSWPMWNELARERVVLWLGFDAGAYELNVSRSGADANDAAVDLGAPVGLRTNLAQALDQALQRAAARPLAGVVVLSDGRSIDEPSRAALRRLQAERVPIFTIPLGSAEPVGDLAIRSAQGPGIAFVNDLAPVRVEIDRLGEAAALRGSVQLIDRATGIVLDEKPLDEADESGAVTLITRPQDAGRAQWTVQLVPDGGDLIEGNNTAELGIELVDRPLRALYIDGVARWEQRYLKNLLLREASITSSNLILAPNRRYLQEGDVELNELPVSPEEWAEFDVVVLGDVRPEVFTTDQLRNLREHIAVRGAGLIWIGGASATPDAWAGTVLADLLPFTMTTPKLPAINERIVLAPTSTAERLGVLQLGATPTAPWPSAISDPQSGWSLLRWSQRIERRALKPASEILAVGIPAADVIGSVPTPVPADAGFPIVLSMRFGAGRALYVATDEIWRWRYGQGELLPERFWLQMVRLLARESLSRSQRSALMTVAPRQPIVGEPARITIEVLDQSLVELDLASLTVRLTRQPGATDSPELADTPQIELTLRREADQRRRYAATWAPSLPGRWRIDAIDSPLVGLDLSTEVEAILADDELRRPETNHALLANLADASEGRLIEPVNLTELSTFLPNRQLRLVTERYETLWDTPLALIMVIFLLTAEWVGRRIIRLI